MPVLSNLISFLPFLAIAHAATSDEWRSRSVYQLLTDRFAPPSNDTTCALGATNYCGGTWQTIISKLDYIQDMGFDAIWISPTALNIEGSTKYGEAYHGYWTADPTKLNPHFGEASDLKALSDAVHSRGMYLMVDIAINALAATSYSLDASALASDADGTLLFKDPSDFHTRCDISWGNHTSEQVCWLVTGDDDGGVALLDLKTESDSVASVLKDWVGGYVTEYGIDGFRIDASKHMSKKFQHDFCQAAGTFCMGEVAGDNTEYAGEYQGADGIDSVCGFGLMYGFVNVFTAGDKMSILEYYINLAASSYPDPTVIGTFLDNQDLPRFNSLTSDASLVYNAIVGLFMYGGVPIVYYGLEQDISDGPTDPQNREALWNYNNYATDGVTFGRITNLNKIRKRLGGVGKLYKTVATVLATQDQDIALQREEVLTVLTNRGTSGTGTWAIKGTKFGNSAFVIDLLSCSTSTTDSNGSLTVTWTSGEPFVFVSSSVADQAGLCGSSPNNTNATTSSSSSASISIAPATSSASTNGNLAAITEGSSTPSSFSVSSALSSNTSWYTATSAASSVSSSGSVVVVAAVSTASVAVTSSGSICRRSKKSRRQL
ncbi:alpha-amylase AmyA [Cryptococcus neoformans Bt85]|nr:alpha-amylase AmyA [Cryptococcus neoformans var. grubii Bt85]